MKLLLSLFLSMGLVACGDSSKKSATEEQTRRLNWAAIPAEFNPRISEEDFQTDQVNRIYVDMFGFKDDVEVVYSNSIGNGQGYVRIFTVSKDGGGDGNFNASRSGQNLQLNRYGTYQCSMKTENGSIAQLKGLCIVRLQIVLPTGAEIEVYNLKKLVSRRFIAMDSETFIRNFKDASFAADKKAAIEDYLDSHRATNKSPQLTAAQLGIVVDGFNWKEEQFEALRKLHAYVWDRENLRAMIEREFSYFDQDEARRICGV